MKQQFKLRTETIKCRNMKREGGAAVGVQTEQGIILEQTRRLVGQNKLSLLSSGTYNGWSRETGHSRTSEELN